MGWVVCPPPLCLGLEEVEIVKRDDDDQRDAHDPSDDALHVKLLLFALRRGVAGGSLGQMAGGGVSKDQDLWGENRPAPWRGKTVQWTVFRFERPRTLSRAG